MENGHYNRNEDDDGATSDSRYGKGSAFRPVKLPLSGSMVSNEISAPESDKRHNIITVPLWGMEERTRAAQNLIDENSSKKSGEQSDDDEEDTEPATTATTAQAPVRQLRRTIPSRQETSASDASANQDDAERQPQEPVVAMPAHAQAEPQPASTAARTITHETTHDGEDHEPVFEDPSQPPAASVAAGVIPRQRQAEDTYAFPNARHTSEYAAPAGNIGETGYADQSDDSETVDYGRPAASGPPPPPTPPSAARGFSQPPEDGPSRNYATDPYHPNYAPAAAASVPFVEQFVPTSLGEFTRPVHDRRLVPYVVAGSVISYLAGRRFTKRFTTQNIKKSMKQVEDIAQRRHQDVLRTQQSLAEQQQQFRSEQQRQQLEIQRQQEVRERFTTQTLTHSGGRPNQVARPYENNNRPIVTEQRPLPPIMQPERPAQDNTNEQDQARPGEPSKEELRIVQDAWLSHAISRKNNREVKGAIEYGQAYQDEVRQERDQAAANDRMTAGRPSANTAAASSVGGVALYGQQGAYQAYGSNSAGGLTVPSLPAGQPTHVDPQHQLPAEASGMRSNVGNPWFWLMLALIVAAFFTAALI